MRGAERRMVRAMLWVRLVDRVSSDILRGRVGVAVKIQDILLHSRLRWYGHAIRRDTNSQMHELLRLETSGKRKKGQPRKL